jgi:cell division initiation protein
MKVTPLDLRQQRFKAVMRGFDREEVTAFLGEVADDYEQALREADRLREELARTNASLEELREHERNLRNTLLTAQRLADEIRTSAELEARRLLRDAEERSELTVQKAQARLQDVHREIDGIRLKRKEEKIVLHRPRAVQDVPLQAETSVEVPAPAAVAQAR